MNLFPFHTEITNELYFLPVHFENKFEKANGYKLADIKNGDVTKEKPDLPYCRNPKSLRYEKGVLKKIREKYPSKQYPGYSSMIIKSHEELDRHLEFLQSIMQQHYVYGKIVNYLGNFPEYCCNILSKNIFVSLLDKGYVNVTIFGDSIDTHAYVGLPFLFEGEKGFLLMDGSSEQLWKKLETPPRNLILMVKGTKWEYKTQWAKGNPLYPNQFLNLQIFRTTNRWLGRHYSRRIDYYFKKVFENPVKIKI